MKRVNTKALKLYPEIVFGPAVGIRSSDDHGGDPLSNTINERAYTKLLYNSK